VWSRKLKKEGSRFFLLSPVMNLSGIFALIGFPAAIFLGGIWLMNSIGKKSTSKGELPLYRRFGYSAHEMKKYWDSLKNGNALETELKILKLDLLFPFFYGAALSVSLLSAWSRLGEPFSWLWIFFVVGAAVVSDWIENSTQLFMMRGYTNDPNADLNPATAKIASLATRMKWVFIVASWGLLLILAFMT